MISVRRASVVCIAVGLAALASPPAHAQLRITAADSAAGARLFRTNCVWCHGIDAKGGRGPNLATSRLRYASTDSAFMRVITDGIPGTPMWGAAQLRAPNERRQILVYVRSLSRQAAGVALPGDSARGEAVFSGRGACSACHTVAGRGEGLGPDLTGIGWALGPLGLRESLIDPGASVHPRWFQARIVDAHGTAHEGRLLNEDTYTALLLDNGGVLRGFEKAGLREFSVFRGSIMVGVTETLSAADIDDVVHYLAALRGGAR